MPSTEKRRRYSPRECLEAVEQEAALRLPAYPVLLPDAIVHELPGGAGLFGGWEPVGLYGHQVNRIINDLLPAMTGNASIEDLAACFDGSIDATRQAVAFLYVHGMVVDQSEHAQYLESVDPGLLLAGAASTLNTAPEEMSGFSIELAGNASLTQAFAKALNDIYPGTARRDGTGKVGVLLTQAMHCSATQLSRLRSRHSLTGLPWLSAGLSMRGVRLGPVVSAGEVLREWSCSAPAIGVEQWVPLVVRELLAIWSGVMPSKVVEGTPWTQVSDPLHVRYERQVGGIPSRLVQARDRLLHYFEYSNVKGLEHNRVGSLDLPGPVRDLLRLAYGSNDGRRRTMPSAGNLHSQDALVVTAQEDDACLVVRWSTGDQCRVEGMTALFRHASQSGAVVIPCSWPDRLESKYGSGAVRLAILDAGVAAAHLAVSARALGEELISLTDHAVADELRSLPLPPEVYLTAALVLRAKGDRHA